MSDLDLKMQLQNFKTNFSNLANNFKEANMQNEYDLLVLLKEVGTLKNLTINKLIYFDEITLDTFSKASDQYQTFFTEYNKQKEYNFLLLIKDNTELQDKTINELIYLQKITLETFSAAHDEYKKFLDLDYTKHTLLTSIKDNTKLQDKTLDELIYLHKITLDTFSAAFEAYSTLFDAYDQQNEYDLLVLLKEVGTLKNLTINKLIYFDEITLDTFSKASDQYQTFFTEYNKQKEYNFLLLIKDNTELQDKTLYELIYFDEITSGTIKSAPDAYKTFFEAYHAQDKYKSLLSEIETNNQFRDIQVTNNILTPNKCSPENILLGSFLSIAALLILYMGVKYLNYTNPSQENVIENNTDPSLDT